jgi:Putative peptidoglycan binding domain
VSTIHTVEDGEHLSRIARKHGFTNHTVIWDHAQNAELKKARKNPNVLFPGDQVFIPDREERTESRSTDAKHRFVAKREPLKFRLVLEDLYEKPIANAKCELHIEHEQFKVTTDGHGKIERDIRPTDEQAFIVIQDLQTPFNEIAIPVKIGRLHPPDKPSGQLARLNNLGYLAGPIPGKSREENEALFVSAVEEFQCDHGLVVDGKCGPVTQEKLKQVHGC